MWTPQRKQLELYCEKCKEPVCPKCVTSLHKGHLFCNLSEITPRKKEKIRNFIDKTEKNVLQDIGNYIASANIFLIENDSTFEKLSKDLKAQTEKLKQNIDKLTAETLSLYQEMKNGNTKLIQKYKQDLELYDEQLKHKMQECKKVLQQGSPLEIYDTECEIDSLLHLPVKPVLGTVSFTSNKHPRYYLELALGTCQFVDSGQTPTLKVKDRSVSLSQEQGQSSTQQKSCDTGRKPVTRTKLLTEIRVVEEWESPCAIGFICPTTDGQAWTGSSNSNELKLMDNQGIVMEVTHTAVINDISLSPTTQRLWACDRDNNILELVSGQLSERFRTNDEPERISVTSDNYTIIGMSRPITKYTSQGQKVLSTDVARTGKPLVCTPRGITVCPITNNVAVIDPSYKSDGGDGHQRVIVMDTDFRELCTEVISPLDINKHQKQEVNHSTPMI